MIGLEDKIGASIPTFHPIVTWIVQHAGEMITKYLVGHDGKTAYQRLWGKPIREETLEIGECIYYRKRKSATRDLETRWLPGVWLGRRWSTYTHLVFTDGQVIEVYAVQRRPKNERWSREAIDEVKAYPWDWKPIEIEQGIPTAIPGTG